MLNFLKNLIKLFSKNSYGTGAFQNVPDSRDVSYSLLVGSAKSTVDSKKTDLSMFTVFNQWVLGTCVAHAYVLFKMWLDYKETGKIVVYSRRKFYAMVRKMAGMVEASGQGLFPRDAGKVAVNYGFNEDTGIDDNTLKHDVYVSYEATSADRKEADTYKAKGYAFINEDDPEEVCVAIEKEGLVMASLPADSNVNWSNWFVKMVNNVVAYFTGRHYIVIYGFEKVYKNNSVADYKFFFRNSWGSWGKNGDGYFLYSDVGQYMVDVMTITDIPNDILERVKNKQYIFTRTLKFGMSGNDVKTLQERFIQLGLWDGTPTGYFGSTTQNLVKEWQKFKGLTQDGVFGPKSMAVMNADNVAPKTKLDLWIEAIKQMENAKPERNNIGNIRFIGQKYAVDDNGFCKFDTYEHGYQALKTLLVNASTGKSKVYNPEMDLVAFYNKYAPSSDGNNPNAYANFVAKYIGVPVTTKIKTLVV